MERRQLGREGRCEDRERLTGVSVDAVPGRNALPLEPGSIVFTIRSTRRRPALVRLDAEGFQKLTTGVMITTLLER